MKKLWGARFQKMPDAQFEQFSSSFKWDRHLLPYDLTIDRAHVKALKKCGVLSEVEAKRFGRAIQHLQQQCEKGTLCLREDAEDVHSAIQLELSKRLGALADKLHTARSRNDLVAQSSRLYCKDHAGRIISLVRQCQRAIFLKAKETQAVLLPGRTHLQNAQVVSLAHVYLSYLEMLDRSIARLELAKDLADVCVLGSGALAGVTFQLDQKMLMSELGLSGVTNNSYDVSGDRDFVLNLISSLVLLGLHISRIAEDLMIGQMKEIGIFDIDQSFCTGSSMMPQKKNADFVELARGASGVFVGNFLSLVTVVKSLPTGYHRDLQWDKRALFESVGVAEQILEIFERLIQSLRVHGGRCAELTADESLYATDLADYLVGKGVPFKIAHEQVGRIVQFADQNNLAISKIGLDLLKKFAPKLDGGVYDLFNEKNSVRLKKTTGSTNPLEVKKQIRNWEKRLKR